MSIDCRNLRYTNEIHDINLHILATKIRDVLEGVIVNMASNYCVSVDLVNIKYRIRI